VVAERIGAGGGCLAIESGDFHCARDDMDRLTLFQEAVEARVGALLQRSRLALEARDVFDAVVPFYSTPLAY
jgi:hypothetical protein